MIVPAIDLQARAEYRRPLVILYLLSDFTSVAPLS
jgi:hypothetical protein